VTADKLDNSINSAITANTAKVTNATHSGEVTGSGALTIADNIVDEANLKVSNSPTNGYGLVARSGNTGGMTWEALGGGKILQVKSTTLSSRVSQSNSSFTDISGLSVSITPSATSSKILVMASLSAQNSVSLTYARLVRGSTPISVGDAYNSNQRATWGAYYYGGNDQVFYTYATSYLDSPSSTDAQTYKIQICTPYGNTHYINYGGSTNTGDQRATGTSAITVMEVGA